MKMQKKPFGLSCPGFVCFAHRGASGYEPENTLPAVEKALLMGAPWIEIDVFSVEGELIVIHDERLEATTNGTGYVMQHSLGYLRSLDAGKGQMIPLLREVFDLVDGRACINVELKGPETAEPTVKLIDEYRRLYRLDYCGVLISSFDRRELIKARSLDPDIPIGVLVRGIPRDDAEFAENLGAVSIHAGLRYVHRAFIDDAHRRGLRVFVYTVNQSDDLKRLRAMGVDGVFTDYPDLVITGKH